MYKNSTSNAISLLLLFGLVFAGTFLSACDSSGSSSEPSYEFEGLWVHHGGGGWGGGGYEHYIDVDGSDFTKHHVSLDVDGNRIGCDSETETIESFDAESNTLTLDEEVHGDGPEIEIEVDSETLTYQPDGENADTYEMTDELPDGAAQRC